MHCTGASSGDRDTVDELSTTLPGHLKITSDAPGERYCIDDDDDEDEDEDAYFSEEDLLAQMGYAKADPSKAEEEEDLSALTQKNEPPKHEPIDTPIVELNLVSALKGSRDRDEGRRAEEYRVSWAPDVYDPPCTSDDHFTVSRTDRHKGGGREIEGRGRGGKGSSKGNVGGSKEKRKAEKKHKKRGDSGSSSSSSSSKYSAHGKY